MAFSHPIGADHPFVAVKALAEQQGLDALAFFEAHDGAMIRLHTRSRFPALVFHLKGDPSSGIDRQGFDYHKRFFLEPAPAEHMLDQIKRHMADAGHTLPPDQKEKQDD